MIRNMYFLLMRPHILLRVNQAIMKSDFKISLFLILEFSLNPSCTIEKQQDNAYLGKHFKLSFSPYQYRKQIGKIKPLARQYARIILLFFISILISSIYAVIVSYYSNYNTENISENKNIKNVTSRKSNSQKEKYLEIFSGNL